MTCGSHEPAPYSMFQRRHEIERKRKVTKYQEQKIIQEKKLLMYIEDDIWVPCCSSGLNVSKTAWERKKNASDQISGAKNNPRKENLLYIVNDMRVPWASSLLNVWEAAWDWKKKASHQISGAKNNPKKETFIVHRVWHAGPIFQQWS